MVRIYCERSAKSVLVPFLEGKNYRQHLFFDGRISGFGIAQGSARISKRASLL